MKSFHCGAWSEAGKRNFDFTFNLRLPLFAIQFFGEGIYFGWIPDEFWNMKKEEGKLGVKSPWYNPIWFLSMPYRCLRNMIKRMF